jgi:CheY-like chemotaxis protein
MESANQTPIVAVTRLMHDESASGSRSNTPFVLLVDDDVLRMEMTKKILEGKFQCSVRIAHSAWSAVEQLSCSKFDLLITDFHMPNTDGLQLSNVVRKIWPTTPILMLSGDSAVPDAARALVDDFVEKGWPTEVFVGRVEQLLNGCRS